MPFVKSFIIPVPKSVMIINKKVYSNIGASKKMGNPNKPLHEIHNKNRSIK